MPNTKQRNPPKKHESKYRNIVCDLYTDNEEHKKVIAKMKNQENIEFWAILHNEDTYTALDYGQYIVEHDGKLPDWKIGDKKKEHWHCCFHCANPRYPSGLAYEIGLHDEDTHLFQGCNDIIKYTHYLWHDPSVWGDKHTYDPSEIFGNTIGMMRAKTYLNKSIDYEDDRQFERIFDYINTVEDLHIKSFTMWLIKNNLIQFYEKHHKVIKPILDTELYERKNTVVKDYVVIENVEDMMRTFA